MKLLIATTNPGKLGELKEFLSDIPIECVNLSNLRIQSTAAETGKSFEENAILKARYYQKLSGLPTLADDGGFEIDALNGEPGVKSHRWINPNRESTDKELIEYTLEKLRDVPELKRGAQLRLVLALALPDGSLHTFEEKVRGIVALVPSKRLTPGFPYRSLLFLPEINKFYDESLLTPDESARFNHRRRAVERLKPTIRVLLTNKR